MVSIGNISLSPCVPHPMYARVNFSLGGTNPAPPSTCRGTITKAVAAAPPVRMKVRRERPARPVCLFVSLVFIGFQGNLRLCQRDQRDRQRLESSIARG